MPLSNNRLNEIRNYIYDPFSGENYKARHAYLSKWRKTEGPIRPNNTKKWIMNTVPAIPTNEELNEYYERRPSNLNRRNRYRSYNAQSIGSYPPSNNNYLSTNTRKKVNLMTTPVQFNNGTSQSLKEELVSRGPWSPNRMQKALNNGWNYITNVNNNWEPTVQGVGHGPGIAPKQPPRKPHPKSNTRKNRK